MSAKNANMFNLVDITEGAPYEPSGPSETSMSDANSCILK